MSSSRQSNAVAASNKLKFKGKSTIMKELQRTASFWAYNTVHTSGNSKAQNAIKELVSKRYFGDPKDKDSMGYAEQLVKGLNAFASMYEPRLDHDDELRTTMPAMGLDCLTMRRQFHCSSDLIVCSANPNDEGINMAVLSSKALSNRGQLSPNNIFKNAKMVEQNGRKALALVQRSEFKDGKLPSGKNYKDYLLFLREAMYKELVCTTVVDGKGSDDEGSTASADGNPTPAANNNNSEMKEDWFFPGYISFALWGPIMPDDAGSQYKAEAFFSGEDTNNCNKQQAKAAGRAKLRAAELEERHYSTPSSTSTRGGRKAAGEMNEQVTPAPANKDILFAAYIAQQETAALVQQRLKQKNEERKLMMRHLNSKIKNFQKELKMWKPLFTPLVINSGCPNSEYILNGFRDAKVDLTKAVKEKDSFVAKNIQLSLLTPQEQDEEEIDRTYMKFVSNTLTKKVGSLSPHGTTSTSSTSSTGAGSSKRPRISSIEIPNEWNNNDTPTRNSPLED